MSRIKVSVVVPVYGNKDKLRQCFDSLVNQTLKDIEIILVDDGNLDEEISLICDEYRKADARVSVIHQDNHGSGYAINRGIEAATGEYIAEADCDDIVELDAYEKLYALADGCDVIKGEYTGFTEDAEQRVELWPDEWDGVVHDPQTMDTADQLRLIGTTCAMWCALYRKDFLLEEGIAMRETSGALFQDTAFTLKTKILAKRFKTVKIPVYRYRCDNPESSTHNISNPYALNDEYADVEGMLKERGINIWTVWSRIKFGGYMWMLSQIPDDAKSPYIFKIYEDMKDEAFNPELFNARDWYVLTRWMSGKRVC